MRQALGPGAPGGPGGSGWRGRWEGGSGCGRHVNSRTFHRKKKKKKIIMYKSNMSTTTTSILCFIRGPREYKKKKYILGA